MRHASLHNHNHSLVPFYDIVECMERVEGYVENINKNISKVRTRGPYSKYVLDKSVIESGSSADASEAKLELKWGTGKDVALLYEGIACDLESQGHKALVQATAEVSIDLTTLSLRSDHGTRTPD